MEVIGWVIWCATCGWGAVCFLAFLSEVFWPNPYPEGPEAWYPPGLRRLITGLYALGLTAAIVATGVLEISKMHLLWFVPVWHLLGVQRWIEWIYLLSSPTLVDIVYAESNRPWWAKFICHRSSTCMFRKRHEVRKNKIDFFHFLFGDDIMNWDLNTRVLRLEKLTRWLTAINLLLILALITIGILYQRSNLKDVVRAENLAIVDWNGNEVAVLRAYGSMPGFRLLKGPDGRPIAKWGEVKPEPNLRLFDESGIETVELSYGQFGPKLSLTDPDAKMGAVLALQEEGPALWFWLAEATGSALLSLDEYGPRLWLLDHRGKRGPSLRFTKDVNNKPRLELLDDHGKTVWSAQ